MDDRHRLLLLDPEPEDRKMLAVFEIQDAIRHFGLRLAHEPLVVTAIQSYPDQDTAAQRFAQERLR